MPVRFHVATGSPTPIYRQIVEQVRLALQSGAAFPGEALPSVRALAAELVVNPNTVAKAYAELCRQDLAVSERGRGVFLARVRKLSAKERRAQMKPHLETAVQQARLLGMDRRQFFKSLEKLWPEEGEQ